MNARFNTNTPKEAAKSLGVSEGVVVGWCRNGVINCNRVGEGTQKDRYEITDDEVHYLRTIILKFGVKDGMLRYRKDWKNMEKPATKTVKLNTTKPIDSAKKEYTAQEAADFLHVDKTTVNSWCRNNKINYRRIDRDRNKDRGRGGNSYYYMIPEWEVNYIKSLYEKYGANNRFGGAMTHYEKDRLWLHTKADNEAREILADIAGKPNTEAKEAVKEIVYGDEDTKLLRDIHYIRDVKARIEDCKNELALLEKEYEDLKAELVGKI